VTELVSIAVPWLPMQSRKEQTYGNDRPFHEKRKRWAPPKGTLKAPLGPGAAVPVFAVPVFYLCPGSLERMELSKWFQNEARAGRASCVHSERMNA
jgi:hypothetical protein